MGIIVIFFVIFIMSVYLIYDNITNTIEINYDKLVFTNKPERIVNETPLYGVNKIKMGSNYNLF